MSASHTDIANFARKKVNASKRKASVLASDLVLPEKDSAEESAPEPKQAKDRPEKKSTTHLNTFFFRPIPSNSQGAIEIHGDEPTLYQGQAYTMLKRYIPITTNLRLSCRSKSNRENILLDMNSAVLKRYFEQFLKMFSTQRVKAPGLECDEEAKTQPTEDIFTFEETNTEELTIKHKPYDLTFLKALVAFVANAFISADEPEIQTLVAEKHKQYQSPENDNHLAPLEWFIEARTGVCRHRALYMTFLLSHYIAYQGQRNECVPEKNKIYRFRRKLTLLDNEGKLVSHAVVVFEAENSQWYFLDATRRKNGGGLVIELTNMSSEDHSVLKENYPEYDIERFLNSIFKDYAIGSGKTPRATPLLSF